MNGNEAFIKSLFEELAKLGPNRLQSDKLKQKPHSSTSGSCDKTPSAEKTPFPLNTPKNGGNTPKNEGKIAPPGTPQGSEKGSIKKVKPSNLNKSDPLGEKLDRNSVRQNEKNQKGTKEKNQEYESNVVQTGLGDHEEKKDEIAQETEQFKLQVGDEQYLLSKNQLAELQHQAAQEGAIIV